MADHERSFYLFLSSVFYVGLPVPGSLPLILDSHSPRSTLDASLPELLTEEDQQLLNEFFVKKPSSKEFRAE
uniref:Uncharacterized protein n=1 Tax=Magallana gigas TaxID=29159 RepID=K1PUM7_MAGGI